MGCCVLSQVLLDDYEKGMTSARLDEIFQEVGCVAHIGFVKAFIMRKWVIHHTLLLCMCELSIIVNSTGKHHVGCLCCFVRLRLPRAALCFVILCRDVTCCRMPCCAVLCGAVPGA